MTEVEHLGQGRTSRETNHVRDSGPPVFILRSEGKHSKRENVREDRLVSIFQRARILMSAAKEGIFTTEVGRLNPLVEPFLN